MPALRRLARRLARRTRLTHGVAIVAWAACAGAAWAQSPQHTITFDELPRPPAGSGTFGTPLSDEYLGYGVYISGAYLWRNPQTGNQSLLGTPQTQITFVGFAPEHLSFDVRSDPYFFLRLTALTTDRRGYGVIHYPYTQEEPPGPFYNPNFTQTFADASGFALVALNGSVFPTFGLLIDNLTFPVGPVPAVPEPSGWAMFGLGAAALWWRKRQNDRRQRLVAG